MQEPVRFDRFELRPAERVLLVDGAPALLSSRAFDLLLCLVENRDRVMSKSEVLTQVWPGRVVEENNLPVHVSSLRKVLGKDAIRTVSGCGYRFSIPVPTTAADAAPVLPSMGRPSIAVLPLNVLSDEPRIHYFAQGLVEDVTALLARVPGFVLIAFASSQTYRGEQISLPEVSQQLGVRFVVQGSVRPRADALRISLTLIEAASARILWSAQFDSAAECLAEGAFDAQESIARGIIRELEPVLLRAEVAHIRRQRPSNLDAWMRYHEAVGTLVDMGWSTEGLAAARQQLRSSISLDPDLGLSHGHYALLTILGINVGLVPDTAALRDEALAAANRAITLDDGSSEVLGYAGCALCDLGYVPRGLDILQRALELNPSNSQAYVAMGAAQAMTRELDVGIERMRYGMKLSPRDRRLGFWGWLLGNYLLRAGRCDEAMHEAQVSSRADPRLHLPYVLQAACLDHLGDSQEAIAALRTARQSRNLLSLDEVTLTHGRQIGERLALLWDKAGAA